MRAALVAAFVCLLVAQWLSPALARRASADGAAAVSAALHGPAFCEAHGGDATPDGDRRAGDPECCVFCLSSGRDAALLFVGAPFFHVDRAPPVANVSLRRRVLDDPDGRPIGWASAWSSRAPPSVFS